MRYGKAKVGCGVGFWRSRQQNRCIAISGPGARVAFGRGGCGVGSAESGELLFQIGKEGQCVDGLELVKVGAAQAFNYFAVDRSE